jgi:nucleotide-binding universal stress UspA family protein
MKVLIAIDEPKCAAQAICALGDRNWDGVELKLLHVVSSIEFEFPFESDDKLIEEVLSRATSNGHKLLDETGKELRRRNQSAQLTTKVAFGEPCESITRIAKDWKPDLIVLGSHGKKGFARAFHGSVSGTVAASVHCPVLVLKLEAPSKSPATPVNRVLVCIDDKQYGTEVAKFVSTYCWPQGTQFQILNVTDVDDTYDFATECCERSREVKEEHLRRSKALVMSVALILQQAFPNNKVEEVIRSGNPRDIIVDVANDWGASTIVLGTHGRKGLEKFMLGSVSTAVLSEAPCSVLIVRTAETEAPHIRKETAAEARKRDLQRIVI